MVVSKAQTVTDFTLTDCNSISQNLFSHLDQGKVVVLIYEHECGSCTLGTGNVSTVLKTHYNGNTTIEVMYLDNGGNSCATTASWISTNSFVEGINFEYSNSFASPYGTGMPDVVIAAGTNHHAYLIANGAAAADTATVHNALIAALAGVSGISENSTSPEILNVYPNPANEMLSIIIPENLKSENCKITVYSPTGATVMEYSSQFENEIQLEVNDLQPALYMIVLESNQKVYKSTFSKN